MSPVTVFWFVGVLLVGACVGSFLNVVIYRTPRGISLVWPPSHCPNCHRRIRWYDNIPIISYILLRGRCRDCGAAYSVRYPIVEALGAVAWGMAWWRDVVTPLGPEPDYVRFFLHAWLFSGLIAASMIDLEHMIIPDAVTVPLMLAGLVVGTFYPQLFLSPLDGMPASLVDWSVAARAWYAVLSFTVLAATLSWTLHLRRLWRVPGLTGPADWVLLGAGLLLSAQMCGTVLLHVAGRRAPALWETFSEQSGFWSAIVGLLGGAAPVWAFRVAGNSFLRAKRKLIAWRAAQWHRTRKSAAGARRLKISPDGYPPASSYVWRVIVRGIPREAPWVPLAPWLAREALGFGDVTLMAAVGAILGWLPAVLAFFFSPFLAIGFSISFLLLLGQREIPLGPFLAIATVIVVMAWPTTLEVVEPRLDVLVELGRLVLIGH